MNKPENPQAFPSHGSMGEVCQEGMTLRDYFAAKAMQGMLSMIKTEDDVKAVMKIPEGAYGMADAMLKERNK